MCNRRFYFNSLLMALTLSVALFSLAARELLADDLSLTITPTGINGSFTQSGTTIYFDSHAEGNALRTLIRTQPTGGNVLANLFISPTSASLLLAGVDVTRDGDVSDDEWNAIEQLRTSNEGTAIRGLVAALLNVMTDQIQAYVSGFSAINMLWRDMAPLPPDSENDAACAAGIPLCRSPLTNCLGCCGPGCWGCTGCCTLECLAHDICVRLRGHRPCLPLLLPAILSMVRCFCRRAADDTSALCLEVTKAQ